MTSDGNDIGRGITPAIDAYMDRFGEHKPALIEALRAACREPAAFDAETAWQQLQWIAFAMMPVPKRKPIRWDAEARRIAQRLHPLQATYTTIKKGRSTYGAVSRMLGVDPLANLKFAVAQLNKAHAAAVQPKTLGRPEGAVNGRPIVAARLLASLYRDLTGRKPSSPSWDNYAEARKPSGFSTVLERFLAALGDNGRSPEAMHKIISRARQTEPSLFG